MPTLLLVYTDIQRFMSFAPNVRGDIQPYKKNTDSCNEKRWCPVPAGENSARVQGESLSDRESLWKGEAKVGVGRRG